MRLPPISRGGRLQLRISRGSPEPALRGYESFGHLPVGETTSADLARAHADLFRAAIDGAAVARADPKTTGVDGALAIEPRSPGLPDRICWGSGTRASAVWTAEQGMNLMSSTLLPEDTGVPFHELQAEQTAQYREAWKAAGHMREPRVSVSRSILPIVTDLDCEYFGGAGCGHRARHRPKRAGCRLQREAAREREVDRRRARLELDARVTPRRASVAGVASVMSLSWSCRDRDGRTRWREAAQQRAIAAEDT